jgi:hypothetical protein
MLDEIIALLSDQKGSLEAALLKTDFSGRRYDTGNFRILLRLRPD